MKLKATKVTSCVAAGVLAALLRVAPWLVILLASLCEPFLPRLASCDESAEFPS